MKTQSQTLFNQNENSSNQDVIKGSAGQQAKTFSAVDMWNIQRQRKTLVIR